MDLLELENRIANIETILGISSEIDQCLAQKVLTAQQTLIDINYKTDKELNQNIFKIVLFLSSQGLDSSLNTMEKAQVIINTRAQFENGSADLQKLIKLFKFVDFDPVIRLDSKQNDISLLQTASDLKYDNDLQKVQCVQASSELLQHKYDNSMNQVEQLIVSNQIIVNKINEKMFHYQQLKDSGN